MWNKVAVALMLALCVALVYSRHEIAQLNAVIHDMEKAAWEADVAAREKQRELENEWQQKADAAATKAAQNLLRRSPLTAMPNLGVFKMTKLNRLEYNNIII